MPSRTSVVDNSATSTISDGMLSGSSGSVGEAVSLFRSSVRKARHLAKTTSKSLAFSTCTRGVRVVVLAAAAAASVERERFLAEDDDIIFWTNTNLSGKAGFLVHCLES
jgi:hypothetical protein